MIATPTEIRHFIEVYKTRHFTRAAIKLGIAQPSLTQSINRLEQKIETQLFRRTKSGCIPTKEAENFFAQADKLNELWESITKKIHDVKNDLIGNFRLGCHQSVGAYTLPNFFKTLSKQAPQIEITLTHDWSRKIVEKILNFELDFGFVVNPFKHRDLVYIKLGSDQFGFWKAKGAKIPERIFADINKQKIQERLGRKDFAKIEHWSFVETTSLELIRTLVVQAAGIGLIPESVALADNSNLELFDKNFPLRQDTIYLAYRADAMKTHAAKVVLEAAKNCINAKN